MLIANNCLHKVGLICKITTGQVINRGRYMGYYRRSKYWLDRIGNRELVGYGFNGQPVYDDRSDFPFPAIRFKEPTSESLALREKEKGDWKLLSKEEKKQLYRASFGHTFAEFQHPTGEWMSIVGYALIVISLGIWGFIFIRVYVSPPLPDSFKEENKRAQLRRMIHLQVNPITGLASNWDYKKNDWKRKTWFTPPNPFIVCTPKNPKKS